MISLIRLCSNLLIVAANVALGDDAVTFPSKPIRIVVPYPAGGIVDVDARYIAEKLSRNIGQPVIVDDRPGASGVIGTDLVAKAAADGYTLLMTSGSVFTTLPFLMPELPFDPIKDFAPVTEVAATPFVLAVHPSLGVTSLKQFIELARAKPGQLSYTSAGYGTMTNVEGEAFRQAAQVNLTHVPYKGSAPSLSDVLAGHAQATFNFVSTAGQYIRANRLVELMQTGHIRLRVLPDVPTAEEAGLPGAALVPWGGFGHLRGHRLE